MSELRTGPAPGHPGAGPHWESSRKSAVGRACNFSSRVWFTAGEGILSEIYFPRPDQPCTKDCGYIVTDGHSFFSEERRDTTNEVEWASPGAPAFRLTNTHRGGRYRIHKEIVADPHRDVVLQRTRFEPLQGDIQRYRLYLLVAPHLGDEGIHNTASFGSFKGTPVLFARSQEAALAIACSSGWKGRSAGFVGQSDGWQDLSRSKRLLWHYDRAEDGNVALTGEIYLQGAETFTLAVGFGRTESEAAFQARASLAQNFDEVWTEYVREWNDWQNSLAALHRKRPSSLFHQSAAVLRTHEAIDQTGARAASLSVPWGEVQKQEHAGGYHAIWARDCAQSALGLLACGAKEDALRTLEYLALVQEHDGHWPQIMWADGQAYRNGNQIDSIAAPLILYEVLRQEASFGKAQHISKYWPLLSRAAGYICRNGPLTQQDRWEHNGGYSVYTLSLAIAGLVVAANAATENGMEDFASYFSDTADSWNALVESWTYSAESELAKSLGLSGCYFRIVPGNEAGQPGFNQIVRLGNSLVKKEAPACEMVSPDVWSLVRYGLRPATDPRIHNTTVAIDAITKSETPAGPVWHRYNNDGYGESYGGEPFSHVGVGRGWPLLVGERAHYELARGNRQDAERLLGVMENFADEVALLPEQVWDSKDIPGKGLFIGRATGSARPLAWAHAEYISLLRSLNDNRVFGCPRLVSERYVQRATKPRYTPWRLDLQTPCMIPETRLRIETHGPVQVRWSSGGNSGETKSNVSPIGLHFTDLPVEAISSDEIKFHFCGIPSSSTFVVKIPRS